MARGFAFTGEAPPRRAEIGPFAPLEEHVPPIGSVWLTGLIVLLIALSSIDSGIERGLPNAHLPGMSVRLSAYMTTIAVEVAVAGLVWTSLRQRGLFLTALLAGNWATPGRLLRDLGFAAGFMAIVIPLGAVLGPVLNPGAQDMLQHVVPKTWLELTAWLALSVIGGTSEELVFRGFIAWQVRAWTGSRLAALVLQGVLFGLAHSYYIGGMILIMLHGCLLGALAWWRKSLLPGILAHVLQDALGGSLQFFFG